MVNRASRTDAAGRRLVLRADAGGARGSGHVMRCLALAEAWRAAGGEALLASAELPEALEARARGLGVDVRRIAADSGSNADGECARALAAGAAALVVDGYGFSPDYFDLVAGAAPVLAIDDSGAAPRYAARWILNQNAHAVSTLYAAKAPGAELLLGGAYALLRGEFSELAVNGPRAGLFATFGGVDPHGASFRFLEALALAPGGLDAHLAIGPANPQAEELAVRAVDAGAVPLRSPSDMAARLNGAALVVTAGGSTLWEGCAAGAPMLVMSVIREEEMSASALAARGGCRYVGPLDSLDARRLADEMADLWQDAPARATLGAAARTVVDGEGAARVAAAILGAETGR